MATAPRGELKAAGRRTSAPPAVNTQGHQQRALLREKSKENQLDRNGCQLQDKDSDRSCFDIGQYDAMKMCSEQFSLYEYQPVSSVCCTLMQLNSCP